ncbi:MAG: hypothetical protein ACOZAL_01735 [Patescibacteria group bacterium]
MKIYNITKGQLITIWIFGGFLGLILLFQSEDWGQEAKAYYSLIIFFLLIFYTIGWKRENVKTSKPTREEIKKAGKAIEEINKALNDKNLNLSTEERKEFEKIQAQLSALVLSPWFPLDWVRRTMMLIVFLVGLYGMVRVGYLFILFWLLLLPFSPRIAAVITRFIGRCMSSENSGNKDLNDKK